MTYRTKLVTIDLEGSPSEFGEPGGHWEHWRERLRDRAKEKVAGLDLPLNEPVKIVCQFRVLKRARGHDLDNLIKPMMDGLGAAGFFSREKGRRSPWDTEDFWVYSIHAEKELVDSAASAGTHIEIWVR